MIRALAQNRATVRNRARLQLQEDAVVLEPGEAVLGGLQGAEAEELEVKDVEQAGLRLESVYKMRIFNEWRICKLKELQKSR